MKINKVIYNECHLNIGGTLTQKEIIDSMTEIFPELKYCIPMQIGDVLHLVSRNTTHQNLLDISLNEKKKQKSYGYPVPGPHDVCIGYPPASREEKEKMSVDIPSARLYDDSIRSKIKVAEIRADKITAATISFRKSLEQSSYTVVIGDVYAEKGKYEHLVGKKAKIIETNVDLDVSIVKAEGDDKEYVIRNQDIKTIT